MTTKKQAMQNEKMRDRKLNYGPWAQFTKYLTICKIIVRSTYDSDLKRAKASFGNIVR